MSFSRQRSRIEQEIIAEREAEARRRQEDLELLATRRPTAVDELRNDIPTPANILPGNCLPDWCDMRLDQSFPNVPAPCGTFLTSIGHLGERIHPYNFCDFDLSDPLMNQTPIAYNSLHDPHLKSFYQENPQVTKRLIKQGLVCCDGRVVSKLSDFNKYRKYLGRLHNLQVRKAKEHQERWDQQAYETTRLVRQSAETEDRLKLQNQRKLKQLTNELCDEEERRQQYLAGNRTQHARNTKSRIQNDNRIKRARRETLRRETLDRARLRKRGHGDHCQQNVMEWICKSEHSDNLRKIGKIEKHLNRQEDLCQFIQCKRAYQQSKRMQRHALLSRNKMEQECRATRRQRKYGNAPENLKRRQQERKTRDQARIAREKYLIEKYGRIWLEIKRRAAPSPYLNSTWNINNVLQGVVSHVKEEAGCQNFADFMSSLLKNKRGGKLDPDTELSVQYILDCIMDATMKKHNQRQNSCEIKLEQLQRAYQECLQGMPSPKDFQSPTVPRRSRQKQIELPRPSYSSGRRPKSAKAFYDPYWSKDCSKTLEQYQGMACSQIVSQVCQQMQSSCLARSCCNPCGPPCCICFPKSKKINWCDPLPASSRRSRSLSTDSSRRKRKATKTKTPTASPRRIKKDSAKSPAQSPALSRKTRGTRGPLTTEKRSGSTNPYSAEDRQTGTNATADRQAQSQPQADNRTRQQQTVNDSKNTGTQERQPRGQNAGTAPMQNQEMKQAEAKPELEDGSTDTVDVPRPTSGSSEMQSEKDPEAETATESPETRPESTAADSPEVAENTTETEMRPSSASQKSKELVDERDADTGTLEAPEQGSQMEEVPSTAREVETDERPTSAQGSQLDQPLTTDKAMDADKPDSRPATAQSEEPPEAGTTTDKQPQQSTGLQPDNTTEIGTEADETARTDTGDDPIPDSTNDQSTSPQTKEDGGQNAEQTAVENKETAPEEVKEGGQNPDAVAERNQGSDPSKTPVEERETSPEATKNQAIEAQTPVENQETSIEPGKNQSVESDPTPTQDQEIGQEPNKNVGQNSEPIAVDENAVGPEETVNQLVQDNRTTAADVVGEDQAEGSDGPSPDTEKLETTDASEGGETVSKSKQALETADASAGRETVSQPEQALETADSSAGGETVSQSEQAQNTLPESEDSKTGVQPINTQDTSSVQKHSTPYKICDPDRDCSPDEWDTMQIPSGQITATVSLKVNSILGDMRDCFQQDCLQGKFDPSRRPSVPLRSSNPPCGVEWRNAGCASENRRCSEMNLLGMDCFGVDLKLEEIRKKFINSSPTSNAPTENPSGASTSTQNQPNNTTSQQQQQHQETQALSRSQPTEPGGTNASAAAAQPQSSELATNQTQTPRSTNADCSKVHCTPISNAGRLSDQDISRAASTFVSDAIHQEQRRLYDDCLAGSGDENRTGTSGIGKTTEGVLSQERFGVNTALDDGNSQTNDPTQQQSKPTDNESADALKAAGNPCSCITDSVMKQLENIRLMLAEVSSELETIGVRGCEDLPLPQRSQNMKL